MRRSCFQFLPGLARGGWGWGTQFRVYEIACDRETSEIRSRILAGLVARLQRHTFSVVGYEPRRGGAEG